MEDDPKRFRLIVNPGERPPPEESSVPQDLAGAVQPSVRLAAGKDNISSAFGVFIGTSAIMLSLYEQIQKAARSDATVLITGESGTGKELCAQALHKFSVRANHPFVPLNCAALPPGLPEGALSGQGRGASAGPFDRNGAGQQARHGTLFLDEIADMDLPMQAKLLQFLQGGKDKRADIRILCATNRDLGAELRAGRFRADLYYRLHVLPLSMPSLRTRSDDILDIAQMTLLRDAAEEKKQFRRFSEDAEQDLLRYSWPGNVRELQNTIRHIVVMHDGPTVLRGMLPDRLRPAGDAVKSAISGNSQGAGPARDIPPLHETERRAIERALAFCGGNVPRAASLLKISPSTIYRKKAGWSPAIMPPAEENAAFWRP